MNADSLVNHMWAQIKEESLMGSVCKFPPSLLSIRETGPWTAFAIQSIFQILYNFPILFKKVKKCQQLIIFQINYD